MNEFPLSLLLSGLALLAAPEVAGVHGVSSAAPVHNRHRAVEASIIGDWGSKTRILRKSSSCPRLALRGGQEGGEDDGGSPDGYQGSTDPITQLGKGGHINQIEYALKAVQKGLTVIAMKGEHTCCVVVERRALPPLQVSTSARKIYQIDAHMIGTIAGMTADAAVLVDRAQVECMNHRIEYEDCPSVGYISRFLGDVMLSYTMRGDARPFGCSIIVSGFDLLSQSPRRPNPKPYPVPRIFLVEPSGAYREWRAVAIGRNSPRIRAWLEKNYDKNIEQIKGMDIETEERFVCELALASLAEFGNVSPESVEVAAQTADMGTRILRPEEVQIMIDNLEHQADADRERAIAAGLISREAAEKAKDHQRVMMPQDEQKDLSESEDYYEDLSE